MKHAFHSPYSCYRFVYEVVQTYPMSTIHKIRIAVNNRQKLAGQPLSQEDVVGSALRKLRDYGFLKSRRSVMKNPDGVYCSMLKWKATDKPISFTPKGRVTSLARKASTTKALSANATTGTTEAVAVSSHTPAALPPVEKVEVEPLISVPMLGERVTFTIPQARDLHRNLNTIFN